MMACRFDFDEPLLVDIQHALHYEDLTFEKTVEKVLHRVRMHRHGLQTLASNGELDYYLQLSRGIISLQQFSGRREYKWWHNLPAVIMKFSRWCNDWSQLMQECHCVAGIKQDMEHHGLQWDHGICFVFLPAEMHQSVMQELPQGLPAGCARVFPQMSTVITTGAMIDRIVDAVRQDKRMKKKQVYLQKLIAVCR
jgi:hypothetical protein